MNTKPKPVRKYDLPKRTLMRTRYLLQKSLRVPIGGIYYLLAVICAVGLIISLILLGSAIYEWQNGTYTNKTSFIYVGLALFCVAGVSVLEFFSFRALLRVVNMPEGHFLNPVRPEVNEVLPEKEVLVRASMLTPDVQRDVLLRAVANPHDAVPELLLRASAKEENV